MMEEGKQRENSEPIPNAKEARKTLFEHLGFSLSVCREKASKKKALNADRQKWIRLLVFTVEAYSSLLKDVELEDLEERIQNIEKRGGNIE
jgi:hypothetical protein